MKRHVTSELNLPVSGHANLDFVDVDLTKDQELFIDPYLVETQVRNNPWCREVHKTITSFFDTFYSAYRSQNELLKKYLLSHATEVDDTHLGYSTKQPGHGNKATGLINKFKPIEELIQVIPTLKKSIDVPLFIPGFAEDGLSDILTNIIHKQLNDYTIQQLNKYGINTNAHKTFFTWNVDTNSWEEVTEPVLIHNGKRILLTPKYIVREDYIYTVEHFMKQCIFERYKERSAYTDRKGRTVYGMTKKTLEEQIPKDNENWRYEYTVGESIHDPTFVDEYHRELFGEYSRGKTLSDTVLDKIIYTAEEDENIA